MVEEIECTVSGRVQLVMYRDFVQRHARGLGLTGWVRNNPDGTVSLLAQGPGTQLDSLVAHLKEGSMLSRVDDVVVSRRSPKGRFPDFRILF